MYGSSDQPTRTPTRKPSMNALLPPVTLVRPRTGPGALVLAGVLALVGCASNPATTEQVAKEERKPDEPDDAHKAEVLRRKIEIAELELAAVGARHGAALVAARTELSLAEGDLATFREFDRPTRVGMATLDLRGTADRAQEAADELAQIQAMYDGQDLDDLTREYVIARGRRHAERTAQRSELEEQNLVRLTDRSLPAEELKLTLAVDRARAKVEDAERSHEVERRTKSLALDDLRYELAQVEKKLAAKP
jgi:hypothetical protein